MSPTRWNVLWNTGAQMIGRFIGAATTFVVSLIIARTFGAQGYGDFAKVTTYVALFYLLADFGMNAIYVQKHQASWGELFGVRVVMSVLLMFSALAILVFLPQGIGQGYTAAVRLGIIVFLPTILFQAIITTTNAAFQKRLRYDLATVAIIAGSAVMILGVTSAVRIGVIGAIGVIGVAAFVTAATALVLVKKLGEVIRFTITRTSLLSYLRQSLPLGLTLVFNLIYFRADHVILTLTRSTAEVGIYGLAYKVFEFPLAIPTFFMNAVFPLMVKTVIRDKQKVISKTLFPLVKKSAVALFLISFLLSLITWLAAPLLVYVRQDFAQSVGALRVLSLGLPFFFLTSLTMWTMIAIRRQKLLALIYGASMIVNVLFNAWLVPSYGYLAAAWITVVSEGLVLFATSVVVRRSL